MAKYRKKPVVIEAVQWTGRNFKTISKFIKCKHEFWELARTINIYTLEGVMEALQGDWIIKGVKGEFYPCKPDIFEQTYEKVD